MASVSSTHLVLFIAAILVAASVAGTVTEGATRLGGALGDQSQQHAEDIDAEIKIVSDAGSPESVYNHSSETLTLYVKNVGGSTLPTDPDTISVLVNGEYQTDIETTVLDADSWGTGNLLRVRTNVLLQPRADTRVVVTPTGARDHFLFRTPGADGDVAGRQEIVFTSSNSLRSVTADGSVTDYDATAHSIGPKEIDFDNDGYREIPYANGTGTLKLIDESGEEKTLAQDVEEGATIGVGEWNGTMSLFYTNSSDGGNIYRVSPETDPSRLGNGISSNAVGGIADFDGDNDQDLVYLGSSANVKYYDGSVHNTGLNANSGNSVYGFGAPRQFDGTTPARAPFVDGSNNIALVNYQGNLEETSSQLSAAKAPVAGIEWTGDDRLERVFISSNGNSIQYVTLDGNVTTVLEDVTVDSDVGVA